MEMQFKDLTQNDLLIGRILNSKANGLNLITEDDGGEIANLSSVIRLSNDITENSKDFMVPIRGFKAVSGEPITIEDKQYQPVGLMFNDQFMPLSDLGLQSYATLTGVGSSYAKKCILGEKTDLLIKNFNEWHQTLPQDKQLFIRSSYGSINALLSERYTAFDNNEIIESVVDVLTRKTDNSGRYIVKNYSVTPAMLNLRIISKDKININGDELSFGFDIKNSNIGKSSVEISVLIFRWICTNGMIMGGGKAYVMKQRHISVSREQLVSNFIELLSQMPKITMSIKEMVEKSIDKKLNSDEMQRIIDMLKVKGVIAGAANRIIDNIEPEYEGTLWGAVNAVTKLSQQYSINTRLTMEKAAGTIMSYYTAA